MKTLRREFCILPAGKSCSCLQRQCATAPSWPSSKRSLPHTPNQAWHPSGQDLWQLPARRSAKVLLLMSGDGLHLDNALTLPVKTGTNKLVPAGDAHWGRPPRRWRRKIPRALAVQSVQSHPAGCLLERALPGRLVRPPAHELRAVPEPAGGDVIVAHLDDELGPQRLPFRARSVAPAARATGRLAGESRRLRPSFSSRAVSPGFSFPGWRT